MARTRLGMGVRDADHRPPEDLIGRTVLGLYLVEEELGAGAMGTVFRGRHVELARPVAIKVMHAHLGDEPKAIARFEREGRAASRLSHPNVVGVLDVGEACGRRVMVQELADGPPLAELIGEPLEAGRVAHLATHILRGLDHAHTAGLVHRDLKPENVIVARDDDGSELPRIVDFGISVLRSPDATIEKLTSSGMIVGTPAYMAPEQARGEDVDSRTDLFGLGVMIYQMLCGLLPFEGSAVEVAIANVNKDPPAIAERANIAVHPLLELFARRLMARRAAARPASANDALALLELIERDAAAAQGALAMPDPDKAAAMIALPFKP